MSDISNTQAQLGNNDAAAASREQIDNMTRDVIAPIGHNHPPIDTAYVPTATDAQSLDAEMETVKARAIDYAEMGATTLTLHMAIACADLCILGTPELRSGFDNLANDLSVEFDMMGKLDREKNEKISYRDQVSAEFRARLGDAYKTDKTVQSYATAAIDKAVLLAFGYAIKAWFPRRSGNRLRREDTGLPTLDAVVVQGQIVRDALNPDDYVMALAARSADIAPVIWDTMEGRDGKKMRIVTPQKTDEKTGDITAMASPRINRDTKTLYYLDGNLAKAMYDLYVRGVWQDDILRAKTAESRGVELLKRYEMTMGGFIERVKPTPRTATLPGTPATTTTTAGTSPAATTTAGTHAVATIRGLTEEQWYAIGKGKPSLESRDLDVLGLFHGIAEKLYTAPPGEYKVHPVAYRAIFDLANAAAAHLLSAELHYNGKDDGSQDWLANTLASLGELTHYVRQVRLEGDSIVFRPTTEKGALAVKTVSFKLPSVEEAENAEAEALAEAHEAQADAAKAQVA